MTLKQLRQKRAKLVREAEQLKPQDGTFADDAARAAFDAKMTEVESVDEQIRALDEDGDPAPAAEVDEAAIRAQATKAEQARIAAITDAYRQAGTLGLADADTRAQAAVKDNKTIDAVRKDILEGLAAVSDASQERGHHRVESGESASDKYRRGVEAWLIAKAGLSASIRKAQQARPDHPILKGVASDPGEFRGMTLVDLARESLTRAGVNVRGMDKVQVVRLALQRGGMNTTSDFTVALENTLHKTLLGSFALAPDTWRLFCAVGSVSDFRAHNRYRTGFLGSLDDITESGEFKNKSIPDAVKESITAGTVGNILSLSRQAIINDDMGVFTRLSTQLGRAAGLSIERDVYALLALNAGLGPAMGDGQTLFHSTHENLGAGSELSVAGLDENRVVMASQTDPEGNEYLDLRPAVLLVPVGLGGQARVINEAQYDVDAFGASLANGYMVPNKVRGLFTTIVDTPRLSGTRRYLFADPAIMPTLEVAFLDGQQEPYMEMQDGFRQDGVEWKVRHDYGVAAVEFRGAVTDAGTT
jgi:phage major head subunit gpT-like protein